jgi:hypothetical protein
MPPRPLAQHLDEAAAVALERLGPTTIVDLLGYDLDGRIR